MPFFGGFAFALAAIGVGAAIGLSKPNKFTYNSVQNFSNTVTQINESSCLAKAEVVSGGNVTIVSDSHVFGDVIGTRIKVSSDASCIMSSANDANIENLMKAFSEQESTSQNSGFSIDLTSLINSLKGVDESITIKQNISNNITQINISTCASNSIVDSSNNFTYIKNSTIGGNVIGVDLTANATSSCTITNNSKTYIYNNGSASGSQKNKNAGWIQAILLCVFGVIAIIVIAVVILFSTGAVGTIGYKSLKVSKKPNDTNDPNKPPPNDPNKPPPNNFPPNNFPPNNFQPNNFPPNNFPPNTFPPNNFPLNDFPPNTFPPNDFPPNSLTLQPLTTNSLTLPTNSLTLQPLPTNSLTLQPLPTNSLTLQTLPTNF